MTAIVSVWLQASRCKTVGAAALAFAAALALSGCNEKGGDPGAQIGASPRLPEPQQFLLPTMHIARASSWKEGEKPSVAAGLRIDSIGIGLVHPRSLYALPNGDVLVVESSGPPAPINRPKDLVMGWVQSFAGARTQAPNRIVLLRDTDGDGTYKMRAVFIDKLHSPFGVALIGNDLYVANTDALVRYRYAEGATRIDEPGTMLTELPGGPIDHHWTKTLLASPDGSKLYVGVGSNSNIAENGLEAEKERAAIWEVDRATGAHRIFASGIRNPTGLDWEPQNETLWAIANERDELGPDLVPDYLTSVQNGGFYGWPYSYYGQHLDPRVEPQRLDLVKTALVPDYALSSHVAPLGLAFYTAHDLPAQYQGGAFVAEHGSWNRDPLNGYKVVFIPFRNGTPSGSAQDVITGFLDADNHARGRPVGLAVDRSGALLIADDLGNIVWRVSATK